MASFANKEQPSPLYWQREVSCVPFSIHHPSNKSAKNLDMCGICVNTHTFSPDVSRARQYTLLLNECPHVPKLAKFKPPRCPIGVYWNTLCLMRDVWTIKTYMI